VLELDAEQDFLVGFDGYPSGMDEPIEAVQEVVRRDPELSRQVGDGAGKHVVAGDVFEDPRLNKKEC